MKEDIVLLFPRLPTDQAQTVNDDDVANRVEATLELSLTSNEPLLSSTDLSLVSSEQQLSSNESDWAETAPDVLDAKLYRLQATMDQLLLPIRSSLQMQLAEVISSNIIVTNIPLLIFLHQYCSFKSS